jgi:hypothetical protein
MTILSSGKVGRKSYFALNKVVPLTAVISFSDNGQKMLLGVIWGRGKHFSNSCQFVYYPGDGVQTKHSWSNFYGEHGWR